ncbi:tRNA(m(1)G37)methyltransferase [Entomophthora muscae]|uniref:tRNA(M(1)G37)methyltransferase n=1 Tax=Entomophthora muscae TaxID=34485 RepID=A0ACC2TX82_9FUNG|nr:tRNA(m(1)G37)methyltransferase [Entomophthora muscae]
MTHQTETESVASAEITSPAQRNTEAAPTPAHEELSPPKNTGMKVLDRSLFTKIFKTLGVKVQPKCIGQFIKKADSDLFNQPRFRNVIEIPEDKPNKLILLKMGVTEDDLSSLTPVTQDLISQFGLGFMKKELEMPYDYWSTDDVLKSILPEDLPPPSSFTAVGHIAHLNLRDEYLPYKKIIGEVILDKAPGIKTVVNKLEKIDTTFRNFQMEVLCGEPDFIATVKENDCRFQLDFSKVYWNSRLHTEHERIISLFNEGDVVCDVFAGVGPFALPAAKKGSQVYANDLNPASHQFLVQNLALNKINPPSGTPKVNAYNLDGRDFLRKAFNDLIDSQTKESTSNPIRLFDHVVMNLPATALEFLDGFRGIVANQVAQRIKKAPTVHVHCFSTCLEDPLLDVLQRASQALGREITVAGDEASLHFVRKVAPKKDMFCLSFKLALEDLITPKQNHLAECSFEHGSDVSSPCKKAKLI